jgi:hypothetical protein
MADWCAWHTCGAHLLAPPRTQDLIGQPLEMTISAKCEKVNNGKFIRGTWIHFHGIHSVHLQRDFVKSE